MHVQDWVADKSTSALNAKAALIDRSRCGVTGCSPLAIEGFMFAHFLRRTEIPERSRLHISLAPLKPCSPVDATFKRLGIHWPSMVENVHSAVYET